LVNQVKNYRMGPDINLQFFALVKPETEGSEETP
jgi:hypothetical protein